MAGSEMSAVTRRSYAGRLLGFYPSSCPVERSFSLQKRIHSKVRNRLAYETVRLMMFVQCNLKLPEPNRPVGDDDLDFLESAMQSAATRRVRLAAAGCDADSVMHLVEGEDKDDDDGVGGSDAGSSGDDEYV
jgi:hypothetical protein